MIETLVYITYGMQDMEEVVALFRKKLKKLKRVRNMGDFVVLWNGDGVHAQLVEAVYIFLVGVGAFHGGFCGINVVGRYSGNKVYHPVLYQLAIVAGGNHLDSGFQRVEVSLVDKGPRFGNVLSVPLPGQPRFQ